MRLKDFDGFFHAIIRFCVVYRKFKVEEKYTGDMQMALVIFNGF
jgi:hypothetical protein